MANSVVESVPAVDYAKDPAKLQVAIEKARDWLDEQIVSANSSVELLPITQSYKNSQFLLADYATLDWQAIPCGSDG